MTVSTRLVLPLIVIAQFFCTSLWFAGNGVMNDLVTSFNLNESANGDLTSAVQFGFIIGTLVFAVLSIADRFSPSKVFWLCAMLGALTNLGITWEGNQFITLMMFRFLTGFLLAGIYPVGMKIAADYFDKGLGKSLGYLVGALVLGTALPHLLKVLSADFPWKYVLYSTSILATFGGFLLLILPDGPYRKKGQKVQLTAFFEVFKNGAFRSAATGYFGHMWELYTFWAFVPVLLSAFNTLNPTSELNVPLCSFVVIGAGSLACVLGGYISQSLGVKKTASYALFLSGLCCLMSPFVFLSSSTLLFLTFLIFWGMVVIADSPLFSTLVAQNAPPEIKGTALTIVNSIGFAITIVSIQLFNWSLNLISFQNSLFILGIGPALGIITLARKKF